MTDFKQLAKDILDCVHPGISGAGSNTQVPGSDSGRDPSIGDTRLAEHYLAQGPGRLPEAMPEAICE